MEPTTNKGKTRHARRGIATFLILLTLACSLPSQFGQPTATPTPTNAPTLAVAAPTATPQPLPPTLVEAQPAPGSELSQDGAITLYFNQPMNRASVEAALQDEPAITHQLEWPDDATLIYWPSAGLAPDSDLNLQIGSGAQSANGLSLNQAISLQYHAAGYLKLTQRLPESDSQDVDPASAVVAAFNRPVVPLGTSPGDLPAAFSLNPLNEAAASGRGEWVNTSTYIFYPEPALQGGKTYLVTPNEGLTSISGSPLESADLWSFSTASPALLSTEPQNGANYMRLDTKIKLVFNQAMDTASVENNFSLRDGRSRVVEGAITWDDKTTELTFTPGKLLERNTTYQVTLPANTQANGGTPLGVNVNITFQTSGALAIVGSQPAQGGQKENFSAVSLKLSALIPDKDLKKLFVITPDVSDLSIYYDDQAQMVSFNGTFEPATKYLLVVSPELQDVWGGKLGQEYILEFQTAPLNPTLMIDGGSDVLFVTPQDTTIGVQAGNLPKLPTSVGSVGLGDFIRMLGPQGYDLRQSFRSGDERSWNQALELVPNRVQASGLALTPNRGGLAPGLYYLRNNLAGAGIFSGPLLLVSSNVNLTFKLSPTEALARAVDLRSSQPVAGASITIYDENGAPLAIGQTDDRGVFQSDIPELDNVYSNVFTVLDQPGGDHFGLAMSSWDQGVAGWDFGLNAQFEPPQLQAYIYTDRPIYRPGQTVYFRAIVRQAYNGRYSLPDLSASGGKFSLTV
jgi:hypothetical protein